MKLKTIKWRNIGPYGNKIQKIEFPEKEGLWMVLGNNGMGKSFFVNLPKILYYGRLNNLKKEEIANRLNQHGWIRGETETRPGTSVVIDRNISPSGLTVYKKVDGEEVDIGKSGIPDYENYIENEVVGLPYNIFSNIVSLSVNDFKSFIDMKPKDKRIIIDKLFAMEVINKMYELIKADTRDIKVSIDLYEKEIQSLDSTIKGASREMEKLKSSINEDTSKRVETVTAKITAFDEKIAEAQEKLSAYVAKDNDIRRSYDAFRQQRFKLDSEIGTIRKKINLYERDKCPTCETDFNSREYDILKEHLQSELKITLEKQKGMEANEQKFEQVFKKLQTGQQKLNDYLYKARTGRSTLANELGKLRNDKPREFDSIRNIIAENSRKKNESKKAKEEHDNKYEYYYVLNELYSDTGVKKKVMDSYLPSLNKEIDYTLNELHFPYKLRFDNDFEPNLTHLGIDINVGTLSTGETKRVDLAVLISFVRMLKRKFPALNMFMLDEVLSSVDGDGIYDILEILKKTSTEMGLHIFIIHHALLPVEYFSRKVEVNKKDGFSDLVVTNLEDE